MALATKGQKNKLQRILIKAENLRLQIESLGSDARDVAEALRDKFDEKSERWQESSAGEAGECEIEAAENIADELENVQIDPDVDCLDGVEPA